MFLLIKRALLLLLFVYNLWQVFKFDSGRLWAAQPTETFTAFRLVCRSKLFQLIALGSFGLLVDRTNLSNRFWCNRIILQSFRHLNLLLSFSASFYFDIIFCSPLSASVLITDFIRLLRLNSSFPHEKGRRQWAEEKWENYNSPEHRKHKFQILLPAGVMRTF